MEKTDNPYSILGLSEDSDEATIKKAYFKLAKKCHPDKQKTKVDREAATHEFAKIADAYDLLQDPVRRYDWRQANQGRSLPSSPPSPHRSHVVQKRAYSNPSTSPMPQSKKASVQPNSVRVSPVPVARSVARPSVRTPTSTVRSPMSPVPQGRNSGGRSPVRNSCRSPVRNSGRSPVRNSGRSPVRISPIRNPGNSPVRASAISPGVVRKPHPANDRKPISRMQTSVSTNSTHSINRAPRMSTSVSANDMHSVNRRAPGRRKAREGSKPKNSLDAHSEHGPRIRPVGERRRRLKKTNSSSSMMSGASTVASVRSRKQ
ncbi:MAG: hypothetical protein SGBAC_000473 [Bacillariaceae sp.]